MKLDYDKDVDAAYFYFKHPIRAREVKRTIKVDEHIILDFGKDGVLLGIEVLDASSALKADALTDLLEMGRRTRTREAVAA
jgi:uncharacterized protein YuzE